MTAALLVIAGPQASGKSTVARALADDLRARGELVALVALDDIAEMALPTLPGWDAAHGIVASVVAQWMRTDLTVVIAEGVGSRSEVENIVTAAEATTVTAALTTTFGIAHARAQADETRGVSRDAAFLTRVYDRWADALPAIGADVVVDTGALIVEEAVARLREALDQARTS